MSETANTAEQAPAYPSIVSGFSFSPLQPALWRKDPQTGLEFRNLALTKASADVLQSRHFRTGGVAVETSALVAPNSALAFVFVLAGRVRIKDGTGKRIAELHSLDCATRYGGGDAVTWGLSHDAEIIEIAALPAAHRTLGFEQLTAGEWVISHDDETHYVQGDGPRKYFRYRDLGVARASNRRVHIHIVRATEALDGGTGWHWHTMGQLFYVLRGWADLNIDGQPFVRMSAGDAMCVAPRMAHNVPAFTADYLVLEMCIPADYDTLDAEPGT